MMENKVICPICGVDITDDLDAETLACMEHAEGDPLTRSGECPHCAHKIKVHLGVDSVSVDHDAEEHRGAL